MAGELGGDGAAAAPAPGGGVVVPTTVTIGDVGRADLYTSSGGGDDGGTSFIAVPDVSVLSPAARFWFQCAVWLAAFVVVEFATFLRFDADRKISEELYLSLVIGCGGGGAIMHRAAKR